MEKSLTITRLRSSWFQQQVQPSKKQPIATKCLKKYFEEKNYNEKKLSLEAASGTSTYISISPNI